jgi:hypothetical protein
MNISEQFGCNYPNVPKYSREVECINPELVIGLELETENCNRHGITKIDKMANQTHFTIETDNSLRGSAYEFISLPMRSRNAIAAMEDFIKGCGFDDQNYSDRCSVHVHVNCTDLELSAVSSLALIYTVFEEILFEFVGHDRESNIYCVGWNQCRAHYDLIQNFLSDGGAVLRRWNKYTALNLIPLHTQGTVEFRHMHGTADISKLTTWINIIGSMFKVAKEETLNNLITQVRELNTSSQYEAFFTRVLGSQLPYNEAYRQKMEEGVIFAKFTLMNMTEKKEITPKKTPVKSSITSRPIRASTALFNTLARSGGNRAVPEGFANVPGQGALAGYWTNSYLNIDDLVTPVQPGQIVRATTNTTGEF